MALEVSRMSSRQRKAIDDPYLRPSTVAPFQFAATTKRGFLLVTTVLTFGVHRPSKSYPGGLGVWEASASLAVVNDPKKVLVRDWDRRMRSIVTDELRKLMTGVGVPPQGPEFIASMSGLALLSARTATPDEAAYALAKLKPDGGSSP